MTLGEHFFHGPFCKCKLSYCMGWFFLILGYTFVVSIILANPLKLKYGENTALIKFIFISAGCFLVTIFSRCICYKKKRDEEEYILTGHNPYYTHRNDTLV